MTSPVTSATTPLAATQATTAAAAPANQSLGQDAFLKLLMAQLQNQDPLQPTDGTEFVTQLAQFTQVQQSVAQSTTLGNISTQISGLANSNATDLVGKTVSIQGKGFNWDGTFAATANVTLAGPAQQVTVAIQDSQGNVVRTMKLGAEPGGTLPITWNGADDSGQPTPAGNYSLNVTAADANGQSVNVSTTVSGVVNKVSFDQGYPVLTLTSGATAPVSDLVSVGATPTSP